MDSNLFKHIAESYANGKSSTHYDIYSDLYVTNKENEYTYNEEAVAATIGKLLGKKQPEPKKGFLARHKGKIFGGAAGGTIGAGAYKIHGLTKELKEVGAKNVDLTKRLNTSEVRNAQLSNQLEEGTKAAKQAATEYEQNLSSLSGKLNEASNELFKLKEDFANFANGHIGPMRGFFSRLAKEKGYELPSNINITDVLKDNTFVKELGKFVRASDGAHPKAAINYDDGMFAIFKDAAERIANTAAHVLGS